MNTFYRPDIFLDAINRETVNPDSSSAPLKWLEDVGVVIEGPCSSVNIHERKMDPLYPMGAVLSHFPQKRSWLHEVLKIFSDTRNVLVFPTCCGAYDENFIAFVREIFSQVKWNFPRVPDLGGGFLVHRHVTQRLVNQLILDGILVECREQRKQEAPS